MAIAEPSKAPFPINDVVGLPPISRIIASIVGIPGDRRKSE